MVKSKERVEELSLLALLEFATRSEPTHLPFQGIKQVSQRAFYKRGGDGGVPLTREVLCVSIFYIIDF